MLTTNPDVILGIGQRERGVLCAAGRQPALLIGA